MAIPRDLLDELQLELAESCDALTREADRLVRLVELNRLALLASLRLGRRITVVELFEELGDEGGQLAALVRALREQAVR
jgi:hypothetical protein